MQTTIWDRGIRAAKQSRSLYEEVERDTNATIQAGLIVSLAAVSVGMSRGGGDLLADLPAAVVTALIGWLAYGFLAYLVGSKLIPSSTTSATPGQVLRTLGFASAPLVFWIFTIVPLLGFILAIVLWTLWLAATIQALRSSMELSLGRAAVVGLASLLMFGVVASIFGWMLGIDIMNIGA